MKQLNYQATLKKLTDKALNQHPVSIPCLIFKEHDNQELFFTYIIDKDVLGQIIYEMLNGSEQDEYCIPIIISLKDNAINQLESKGVYTLDIHNNQFIYLFGTKDQENFFNTINKIASKFEINPSLIIGYLSTENKNEVHQMYANKLKRLLELHGDIYGKYIPLDNTEEIEFPLITSDLKLNLIQCLIRKEGVENAK